MSPRIVFMGTPDFAVASLDAIVAAGYDVAAVVTTPDRPAGRGQKLATSAVKQYALSHNLPLLQPEKLRDPTFLAALEALHADLFVVVAFRMLPQCVWAMPPMGTFNLHASLLPRYRGAAPINWALINGEQETGVTTFLLNERIDEGSILLQESTPIHDDDNVESLHDRLADIGRRLVVRTIEGLAVRTLIPKPQTVGTTATLPNAPKIFKEDCQIHWNQSTDALHNFIRGLSPYPAAWMRIVDAKGQQQTVKIYETRPEKGVESSPGSIISDGKTYLKVATSDGNLQITSLQMSGKQRISVKELLRGYNVSLWKTVD